MVPQEEGRWGAQPIRREAVPHGDAHTPRLALKEVVPDKRYVFKLKKALNGLVAASKRFQQYLFRLLRDLGFESCPC